MMTREEFLALLARLRGEGEALTPDELRSLVAAIPEHAEDGELVEIEAACQALGEDDEVPLDTIRAAVEVVEATRTEAAARIEADEQEAAERETLRRQLAGETADAEGGEGDGDGDPDGEGDPEGDAEPEGEGEGAVSGDAAGEGDADGEGGDAPAGDADGEGADAGDREPAGATASGQQRRRAPGQMRNRRTAGQLRDRDQRRQRNRIIRDGGGEFGDLAEVAEAMLERRQAFLSTSATNEKVPVARIEGEYPEERQLDAMNPYQAQQRIGAVTAALFDQPAEQIDAVVAAGGLCAPLAPYYGIARLAEADRPFAAGLERFQAQRGGIIYRTPPDFPTFANAVDQWTVANDADPGSDGPGTKPCLRVPCSDTEEAVIYAVTECLTFGNFLARTDPETTRNAVENTAAAFARKAETLLIDAVKAASTAVSAGQALGAYRDLLYQMSVAAVAFRSRHRMRPDAVLEVRFPAWVEDMVVLDLMRSLPGDQNLALARNVWNQALGAARLRVASRYIDSPTDGTSQVFGTQAAAALLDFPETVQWQLSAPGSFLMLENGRLDLGIVRDSTLNATNDYQTFAETFEGVAFVGLESLWVESTVCPNGASSGTVDPSDFCSGHYVPSGA